MGTGAGTTTVVAPKVALGSTKESADELTLCTFPAIVFDSVTSESTRILAAFTMRLSEREVGGRERTLRCDVEFGGVGRARKNGQEKCDESGYECGAAYQGAHRDF